MREMDKHSIDRWQASGVGLGDYEVELAPDGEFVDYEDFVKFAASNQKLIGELVEGLTKIHDALLSMHVCDLDGEFRDTTRELTRTLIEQANKQKGKP